MAYWLTLLLCKWNLGSIFFSSTASIKILYLFVLHLHFSHSTLFHGDITNYTIHFNFIYVFKTIFCSTLEVILFLYNKIFQNRMFHNSKHRLAFSFCGLSSCCLGQCFWFMVSHRFQSSFWREYYLISVFDWEILAGLRTRSHMLIDQGPQFLTDLGPFHISISQYHSDHGNLLILRLERVRKN